MLIEQTTSYLCNSWKGDHNDNHYNFNLPGVRANAFFR